MDNLQSMSLEQASLEDFLNKSPISFSASEIKRSVPRINFKKLKLSKLQNIGNFISETISHSFIPVDIVESVQSEQDIYKDNQNYISPLRKNSDSQSNVFSEASEIQENISNKKKEEGALFDFSETLQKNKKDESSDELQAEEIISSSGEQSAFVWPPKEKQTKRVEEKDLLGKKHKKKKTYFLSSENEFAPDIIDKTNFSSVSPKENISTFPWANSSQEYETIESLFHGGLETELLDNPINREEIIQDENNDVPAENDLNNEQKNIFSENDKDLELLYEKSEEPQTLFLKAIGPEQVGFEEDELIKKLNLSGRAKDMNYKHNRKNNNGNAVRVVVWGGLLLTCGYFALNYFMPEYKNVFFKKQKDEKIYVRDLFKKTHSYKTHLKQSKNMGGNLESLELLEEEEDSLKPITEQDRIALIQKAKESIESKDDPFGQDLPQEVVDEMAASVEKKPPPDVPLQRKQVELVGVISTDNKNLALVNVYIADYTIASEDDKEAKETKLKTALSMAVPNRLEVSLLDPVEDWYVKQILKSKSRNEDPIIELVKGDKKFKLKVGQKVLLPEEKTIVLEKE